MTRIRDFLRWYLRSALGVATMLASAAAAVALGLAGLQLLWALLASVAFFGLALVLSLASGAGAKAAVRERQRDMDAALASSLDAASKLGDRISALRLADPEIKAAAAGFSLAFSECLSACRREGTRDPQAEDAGQNVLDALTAFLKEMDGSAQERRFDLPDADPFPDAKAGTLAFLKERTVYVRTRRMAVDGGLGGRDRLAIEEELR